MKLISLTKNKSALVDDEDYEHLMQWKWCVSSGYPARRVTVAHYKSKMQHMHRDIMNIPQDMFSDHINGDRLDNRRINLRICTRSQNQMNREKPKHNTSGYKGVFWQKENKNWYAKITVNKKQIHLGCFSIPEKAAEAYNEAARQYHGKFVRTSN